MSCRYAAFSVIAGFLFSTAAFSGTPQGFPPSVHADLWPQRPIPAADPATEKFVQQLLDSMSLEEKIGQMIQADIASIVPADLQRYKLGSILAGGNAAPNADQRSLPQAWLNLTTAFHQAAVVGTGGHPAIPILFGIDAVHGNAKVRGATIFPHNVALGAMHDPQVVERIGAATAEEVAAIGVDWAFAPTLAVVRDVRWGRSYESYSEDPLLVAQYAPRMVTGLQGRLGSPQFLSAGRTLSSVKHFVGDGGTESGRDQGDTRVSEAELAHSHAAGYLPAIDAGALIVMASYNSWYGAKLHASHYLITDILKERMGFNGFVVGDWNAHEQIPGCTKQRCAAAILAGVDMLMAPDNWKHLFENTLQQAKDGEIPAARIDDAVRRILRVKVMAGLFKRSLPLQNAGPGDFSLLGSSAHRMLAREAVRKSLVLLKNNLGTLPIDPKAHVLVAGDLADDIGSQAGGWTVDWQGDHNSNADFPGATSIYAGINNAVTQAGGSVTLDSQGRFDEKPDVAIVVFGEGPYAEFEGDRENLAFAPDHAANLALLKRLRAAGIPIVSVFLSGRPLWVNPELNASDSFVAAWLPGSEGEGVADVLFGAGAGKSADFSGRLAFSWPKTAMPVRFDVNGHAGGALFERGFGLTYADKTPLLRLEENPQIAADSRAPAGSLFRAGHVTAPWSIFVSDTSGEVHLTNQRQQSPLQGLTATHLLGARSVTAAWSGTVPSTIKISGRAANLRDSAHPGTALQMRYRLDRAPDHAVRMGVLCSEPTCGSIGGAMIDFTAVFQRTPVGQWATVTLPMTCLSSPAADLTEVLAPFALESTGAFSLTIADVRLVHQKHASAIPDCSETR